MGGGAKRIARKQHGEDVEQARGRAGAGLGAAGPRGPGDPPGESDDRPPDLDDVRHTAHPGAVQEGGDSAPAPCREHRTL